MTRDEAITAIERCKFVIQPDPEEDEQSEDVGREIVHCILAGNGLSLGADWDVEDAIALVNQPDAIFGWSDSMHGQVLVVIADQETFWTTGPPVRKQFIFDTVKPV